MGFAAPAVGALGIYGGLGAGAAAAAATAATVAAPVISFGTIASTAATLASAASWAGRATSVVGAITGVRGDTQSAQAAAAASRYNAAVAANNALIAKQNRDWAGAEGNRLVEQQQMKTRAEMASLKANQGASGVRLDSKSFVDVQTSAEKTGELSAIDLRTKAARQAYGYDVEAASHTAQSQLDSSQAGFELEAGKINSATTLLGGLSSAASGYGDYMQAKGL